MGWRKRASTHFSGPSRNAVFLSESSGSPKNRRKLVVKACEYPGTPPVDPVVAESVLRTAPALMGHLHRRAALGGRLPDLRTPGGSRSIEDPLAIRRPCRDGVGRGVAGDASRRSAVGTHHKDVAKPELTAVKRHLAAARGKTWVSHRRSTEA